MEAIYNPIVDYFPVDLGPAVDGSLYLGTDDRGWKGLKFPSGKLMWLTEDPDANVVAFILPDGDATNAPVLVVGDSSTEKNLAMFNGFTQPLVAIMDDDATSYVGIGFRGNDAPAIKSNQTTIEFQMNDTNDFVTIGTINNIPTIWGTGEYLRIGDAAVTSHGLNSEDDLLITGDCEVDGSLFFDGALWAGASQGVVAYGPAAVATITIVNGIVTAIA